MKLEPDFSCEQVVRLLPSYIEEGLGPAQAASVTAHLQQCAACRVAWQKETRIGRQLAQELQQNRYRPSAEASARMRSRLERKMRREQMMVQTKQLVRGLAALAVLMTVVGLFAWWQRPDSTDDRPDDLMPDNVPALAASPGPTRQNESGATPRPTVPVADRQIVRMGMYTFDEPRWRPFINRFEEENPEIDIQPVYINELIDFTEGADWSGSNSLLLAANADLVPTFDLFELVSQGLVLDLQPLLNEDSSLDAADFYPGTLESQSWQGGIWGLPLAVDLPLILYQKELFAAAGLEEPGPGWTWEEFLVAANTLTGGDRWGFVPDDAVSWSLLRSFGGLPLDPLVYPPAARMNSEPVVAALRWYDSLVNEYQAAPLFEFPDYSATSYQLQGGHQIVAGKAAMWEGNLGTFSDEKEQMEMRQISIGAAPMPVSRPDDRTTYGNVSSYALSASTVHPDAAWRWLRYLSEQVQPGMSSNEGDFVGMIPARRSVAEASGYWERLDPEVVEDVRFALEHSVLNELSVAYSKAGLPYSAAVERVLVQGQSPELALEEAQAEAEILISETALALAQTTPIAPVPLPTPPPPGQEGTTIVFYTTQADLADITIRQLARQFQAENPGLTMEVRSSGIGSESFEQVAAQADCFQWGNPWLTEAELSHILRLDPFLDADPDLSRDDFYPLALTLFKHQGRIIGLPASVDLPVLAYRPALFDAAGLAYPQGSWSPEAFLEAAASLSGGEGEQQVFGFVPFESESNSLRVMLSRLGANLVDVGLEPPGLALNDPATTAALEWYVALSEEYGAKPVLDTSLEGVDPELFAYRQDLVEEGRDAMWISFGWRDSEGALPVAYAPLPSRVDAVPVSFLSSSGYFISATSQQPDACWQWLRFLSTQPDVVESGLPARPDVTASAGYQQRGDPTLAAALEEGVLQAGSDNSLPGWYNLAGWAWLTRAYEQAVTEGVPVSQALADAQVRADAYRTCILARAAEQDGALQSQCLREVDDTLPDFYYGSN